MFDSDDAYLGDHSDGELVPPRLSVVDVELDPDRAAAELTYLTPGVEVGGGVGLLDPTTLSQAGRLVLLVVLARQAAWVEALTQRTVAALDADAEAQAVRERPELVEFAHLPDPAAMLRIALAQADARDSIREEIALALRVPSTTAATRITLARRLVDQLPTTLTALSGGVISPLHARVLADRVDGLDPEAIGAVERRVLPRAGRQTVANFQRCITRAVACEQPKTAAQRHTDAAANSGVWLRPLDDGMAELVAMLPADHARYLYAVLNRDATVCTRNTDSSAGHARIKTLLTWAMTADQRARNDGNEPTDTASNPTAAGDPTGVASDQTVAAGESTVAASELTVVAGERTGVAGESTVATGDPTGVPRDRAGAANGTVGALHDRAGVAGESTVAANDPTAAAGDPPDSAPTPGALTGRSRRPSVRGCRPDVRVTIALETLLGWNDQPADLDGYGPIPASMARRIAADPTGTWRRLITDQHGRLLDYGRTTYRPPTNLADHTRATYPTCVMPGCQRPATESDLDHRQAWTDNGTTNGENLAPLCRRHHRVKHRPGWTMRRLPNGDHEWTTPPDTATSTRLRCCRSVRSGIRGPARTRPPPIRRRSDAWTSPRADGLLYLEQRFVC